MIDAADFFPGSESDFPEDPLVWARWYRSLGISIIPVKPDGTKAPAIAWSPYRARLATDEELRQWFDGGAMFSAGIGIVTGKQSGDLVMIEAETQGALDAFAEAMGDHGLSQIWNRLDLRVRSGGGGCHIYYRCPDACGTNVKLAQKPKDAGGSVLIETRAEGGYAVAPGSPLGTHRQGPYRLESGTFERIPALSPEEQKALFLVAGTLDQRSREPMRAPATHGQDEGLSPGDDFNNRCTADQHCGLLEKHGWHSRKQTPRGYSITRPGKSARDGSSGAVLEPREGVPMPMFYCHTTSTDFEQGAYSPFATFAILEHGGNYSEAAAELRRQGYGEPITAIKTNGHGGGGGGSLDPINPIKPTVLDTIGGRIESRRYYSKKPPVYKGFGFNGENGENASFDASDPWDAEFNPVAEEAPPAWPQAPDSIVNALRAEAFARTIGVSLELFAPLQIATIAGCAQGRVAVAHPNQYREALCVWVASIGAPGSRKSSATKALSKPLEAIEREAIEESRSARNEWESKCRKLRRILTEAENKKPSMDSEDERICARETLEMHESERPRSPAFLLQDFTPEALDQAMHEGEERVVVFDPEATLFVAFANPRHGRVSNDANICKYFGSEPVRVNRKGGADGGRTSYHIESGSLTLCIGSQPSKVRAVLDNEHLMGSGFALRFLFSKPPYFTPDRSKLDPKVKADIERWWDRLLRDLWHGLPPGGKLSEVPALHLGPEAEAVYDEYADRVEASHEVSGEAMQSWLAKAVGYSLRIAAVLHLAVHRGARLDAPISEETMRYAVDLMGYFEAHSRLLIERSSDRTVSDVIRFAELLGKPRKRDFISRIRAEDGIVSFSDLTRELRPMDRDRIEEGILAFEDIGWARQLKRPKDAKGRAGRSWQIRPEAFDEMVRLGDPSRNSTA